MGRINWNRIRPVPTITLALVVMLAVFGSGYFFGEKNAEIKVVQITTSHTYVYEVTETVSTATTYKVTAYCPCSKCCGKWANGITATGTTARANHTIAVDPKIIPLGSKVLVDGKEYVAEDTGGAIKGNKIDIYFDTHEEALEFGVQYLEVELVD